MTLHKHHLIAIVTLAVMLITAIAIFAFRGDGTVVFDGDPPTTVDLAEDADSTGNSQTVENTTQRQSYVWWGPAGSLSVDDESSATPDYRYVIPLGTGDAIEAGQQVDVLPAELEVRVGETIEIVNEDDQLHFIGPFTVFQGESLRQRFSEPGESLGTCSAHVLGSVRVVVNET